MATPVPAAANTVTEFLFTADSGSSTITGFKINGDGSLSPDHGVAFVTGEAPRKVVALGEALIAAGRTSLTVYAVEKDTGTLHQSDTAVLNPLYDFLVDPSTSLIYAASMGEVAAYRLAAGKLQAVPGSPFRISGIDQGSTDARRASLELDRSRNLLLIRLGAVSLDRPASVIAAMTRHLDGSLEPAAAMPGLAANTSGFTATSSAVDPRTPVLDATGRFAYVVDPESSEVFAYRLQAGKLISLSPASYPVGKRPLNAAVVLP